MASRELSRLQRLNLNAMKEDRLRNELQKAITNLGGEDKQIAALQTEFRRQAVSLQAAEKRETVLNAQAVKQKTTLDQAQSRIDELTEALTAASKETGTEGVSVAALAKLAEVQVRNTQLQASLNASNKLIERLQATEDDKRANQSSIRTADLFAKFTGEIDQATRAMEGDFVIDDVEVEVRGAMGLEAGEVVMGLDHKRAINDQSATRIKFALRRKSNIKIME